MLSVRMVGRIRTSLTRTEARAAWCGLACGAVLAVAPGVVAERMPAEQAKTLQNPVAYAPEAVKAGRNAYLRLCQYCHGADGRAQANPDFEAPSLRDPDEWRYGATDGEVFVSIRDGAGHEMPPFGKQLQDDEIWRVVLFIRSIGPKELRPETP